jgi:mRNA interferase RelE/StbE
MKKNVRGGVKWEVILTRTAIGQLDELDVVVQRRIHKYLRERLECADDPRKLGKYLVDSDGLYRFRVGDYRLVSFIDDGKIRILVLAVGHRGVIYKRLPKRPFL